MHAPSRRPFSPLWCLLTALRENGGVSPRRLHILAAMLSRYVLLEPLRLAERLRLDAILDASPLREDPIFVVGHWRSGTSHLQTLLGLDPALTTATLYRSLLSDISWLTVPWLKRPLNATARLLGVPFSLQRMPMDFDIPAEGDVGLLSQLSPNSYTWGHIFPRRLDDWLDRLIFDLSPAQTAAWLADYDRLMRKVSLADGGRRVVMKSPGDTARLSQLAAHYPSARFVAIHRDPIAVFHSSRYFWSVIRNEYSLHVLTDAEVDEIILRTYPRIMARYLQQRQTLAAGRLVEVTNAALRSDPVGTMRRVYSALQLGALPAAVVAALQALPVSQPRVYETPPALEARIRQAWGPYFHLTAAPD